MKSLFKTYGCRVLLALFFIIFISALVFLLFNNFRKDAEPDVYTQDLTDESAPVKEDLLVDKVVFEDSLVTVQSQRNTQYYDCGLKTINVPMELKTYLYKDNDNYRSGAEISLNMDRYRTGTQELSDRYDSLDELLNGDQNAFDFTDIYRFNELFGISCGDDFTPPTVYSYYVDYPGTEAAIALLNFGSIQSAGDAESSSVSMMVLARVGTNYIKIYELLDPSEGNKFIENVSYLEKCEQETESGIRYISMTSEDSVGCVQGVYNEYMEIEEFKDYVEGLLYKFRLEL